MVTIHPFLFFLALLILTACPPDPDPPDNGDDNHLVYKYVFKEVIHSPGLEYNLVGYNPGRSVKVYLLNCNCNFPALSLGS